MRDKASECKLDLFQDADVAGTLFFFFGDLTFVSLSWAYKKQTAVLHSSAEAEVIPLDNGLRLEGLVAFT